MIYVFRDVTKIPKKWIDKLNELKDKMDALETVDERKAFIDEHYGVWKKIRNELLAMSFHKCWYSEATNPVSDWHIDHFRPEKRISDDDGKYDGYYWLAFDWTNYRVSGAILNRKKSDTFPLAPGCERATWDNRDLNQEIYMILDPADKQDPYLLIYDEEGLPKPINPQDPRIVERVRVTKELLKLDDDDLVRERKDKWLEIAGDIEEIIEAVPADYANCQKDHHRRVDRLHEKLKAKLAPDAAYASTARACAKCFGYDYLLMDMALETAQG